MTPTEEVYRLAEGFPESRLPARADAVVWLLSLPDRLVREQELRRRLERTEARIAKVKAMRSPYRGVRQSSRRPCWALRRADIIARLEMRLYRLGRITALYSFAAWVSC